MTNYITEWKKKELVAKVSGNVINGVEAACQFVEGQAQARAPVRSGVMKSDISHKVIVSGDSITGHVGVFKTSKAFYAYFQEMGTAKMAAHPFLRPAVFGNAAKIRKLVAGK